MTEYLDPSAPFWVIGADRPGPWLITCDHATNRVPPDINGGDLGLPAADMNRHIAFDPGSLGVSLALGELLDSPVIATNFSRLVIDPNRGEDDPTVLMRLYDGTIIPANRHANAAERERRLATYHRPYHDAYEALAQQKADPAVLAIHSFTPQLTGRPRRPWEIGILFASDDRLSRCLISELQKDASLTVGINEPYSGHLPGDSIDRHALRSGRQNTLVELRNDLISNVEDQRAWARRLREPLTNALNAVHQKDSADA
ncbi:N-formylglutamate amidohydrolase [Shimia ponticola]|uniref:N-formylglutamate amidohydrolase n=1 Tax=Shimia ponticola TaxID=2582893 RepID=UPI002101EE65|nr:N-formylglutamate amidohydrolase [Shimia ponticola]